MLRNFASSLIITIACLLLMSCGGSPSSTVAPSGAALELMSPSSAVVFADSAGSAVPKNSAAQDATQDIPASAASVHSDPTLARFNGPQGIALDRSGDLYVADSLNY